jgi:phosphoribosylaminoimidazole-succinocarboxamide synthase
MDVTIGETPFVDTWIISGIGSGWAEYRKTSTVCKIPIPKGLTESAKLEKPLFTPSTKAEIGAHGVLYVDSH